MRKSIKIESKIHYLHGSLKLFSEIVNEKNHMCIVILAFFLKALHTQITIEYRPFFKKTLTEI